MTSSRNKNGQFAPKNPDCEPATKGFVKCIARKLVNFDQEADIGIGVMWFLFLVVSCLIFQCSNYTSETAKILVLITLAFVINRLMIVISNVDRSRFHIIQKYEPPKCEQKKECGDD